MEFQEQIPSEPVIEHRKSGRFKIFLLGVVVLLLVAAALVIFFRVKISTPLSRSRANVVVIITPGERSRTISDRLYSQGIISSSWIFDVYLAVSNQTQKIQAGTYVLSPSMNMRQIAGQLVGGKVRSDIDVLQFKEGWTLSDIEKYLAQNGVATSAQFDAAQKKIATTGMFGEKIPDASLEGYIFPDTYFVSKGASSETIIQKALDNLNAKLTPDLRAKISAQHKTVYEILTMASIVEREVGRNTARLSDADIAQLQTERRLVAGIFYKRLAIGMPLQSDATVNYITKKTDPSVSIADTKIDSPYNTYLHAGLPPGPISNPSLSSIEAAIDPQASDYLYFLSKPDGTAVFAKTLQEQQQNQAKYLK